jgi:hypothetical protein
MEYYYLTHKAKKFAFIYHDLSLLPVTIPMDMITLIQYTGLHDSKNLKKIYDSFNNAEQDLQNNTTKIFFDDFFNTYVCYAEEGVDDFRIKKTEELEKILSDSPNFGVFYVKLKELFNTINQSLPRPIMYYKSFHYLSSIISKNNDAIEEVWNSIFDQHLTLRFDNFEYLETYDKFGLLKDSMPFDNIHNDFIELFYQLANNNIIEIGAIPHLYRNNERIASLYERYSMGNLVPSHTVEYKLENKGSYKFVTRETDIRLLRQMLNYAKFCEFNVSEQLRDTIIHNLSDTELYELIDECFFSQNQVSFINEWNVSKYPEIYCEEYIINEKDSDILFLSQFGYQYFNVFLSNSEIIDNTGYHDVEKTDRYTYKAIEEATLIAYVCSFNITEGILNKEQTTNYLLPDLDNNIDDPANNTNNSEDVHLQDTLEDNVNKDNNTNSNNDLPF